MSVARMEWWAVMVVNCDTDVVEGVHAFTEPHPTILGPRQTIPLFSCSQHECGDDVRREFEALYPYCAHWWRER